MATHVSTLTFFNKLIFNRASIRSGRGKTLASHEREREGREGGREACWNDVSKCATSKLLCLPFDRTSC